MALRTFLLFAILYALLFAAFGAEVPFIPSFLTAEGLSPPQIGVLLAAATIAQFAFAPLAGIAADATGTRRVLAIAAVASAASILLYRVASGFWALAAAAVLLAIATAPLNPLADALAVPASAGGGAYGRIRGIGSAGFIAGTLAAGVLIARFGIDSIVILAAVLFAAMILPVPALPPLVAAPSRVANGGLLELLSIPAYRRVLLVSGLVIGSHAMSDAFAVIAWRTAGLSPDTVAVLLALAVGSELLVFVGPGPRIVARLGPSACAVLGAIAGCCRWGILAESRTTWIIAASQLLHGITFALVHLACMQVIAAVAPRRHFATAQALYGTVSSGLASAAITLAAGVFYGAWQAHAFWLMSALCIMAVPTARRLGRAIQETDVRGTLVVAEEGPISPTYKT